MRTWGSSRRILKLPCWTSTSKNYNSSFHGRSYLVEHQPLKITAPHSMGSRRLYHSNVKVLFSRVFYSVNFFTPKLMKIRWSFSFFWVFCTSLPNQVEHTCLKFQLQICTYEWARIIFVDRVLTPNLNTMDLVKVLEKNQKLHIQIVAVTLKVTSCKIISKNKRWKKVKNQDFMGKTNYFLRTLLFSPWAVSATWLHVGAP
jgi:hypothetical protein